MKSQSFRDGARKTRILGIRNTSQANLFPFSICPRLRDWSSVLIALLCLALGMAPLVPVSAQSGGSLDLRTNVIAGGGDTSTGSGNLQISGTVGQPAAGTLLSGGTISQTGGFWSAILGLPTATRGTLQFTAGNYSASEDCAGALITVTRTGDTNSVVTVGYTTNDGTALQKSDYTISLGTLTFAPNETSKTVLVLIAEDSFVEAVETATITLSNPTPEWGLGILSTTTLTILDDATEPAANPIDTAGNFVCQHYHDFLNREADSAGLAFWINQISSCGNDAQCVEIKRINVSAAYFLSIEFQETGYLVYRFYNAALNRSNGLPRYLEFLRDTQAIGRGVIVNTPSWEAQLEVNKVSFAGEFVSRSEFTSLYPVSQTPSQYVDALFAHAVITPTATERQAAIDEFGGAATSADSSARARVLRRVAENQTVYQREFNRAFVLMQYFGYLRRNPDDAPDNDLAGYNFWLNKLNEFNGNFVAAEMVKAFIVSGEYRQRFGP